MEPLRIARPIAQAEGEEIDPEAVKAYLNRVQMMNQTRLSRKRKRSENGQSGENSENQENQENQEEEVWEVPLNLFNFTEIYEENERKTPLAVKQNITWSNKPPTTPKSQMIKPKNQPPKLKQTITWANKAPTTPKRQMIKSKNQPPKLKRNRKTRKMRKSRKQNRK